MYIEITEDADRVKASGQKTQAKYRFVVLMHLDEIRVVFDSYYVTEANTGKKGPKKTLAQWHRLSHNYTNDGYIPSVARPELPAWVEERAANFVANKITVCLEY